MLYAANRITRPDSSGFVFQADYTPFGGQDAPLGGHLNLRLGVQYFLYTRFDGAGTNYDGAGHDASGNDTLRLFAWFAI